MGYARVIGVDLGRLEVAASELSGGSLGESRAQPTQLADAEALIDQVVAMIEPARSAGVLGVGIGVPGVVELETGRVVWGAQPESPAGALPLAGVALRQVLAERTGVPVFVDSGASLAAFAEAHDDETELAVRHLVMFSVGDGVGGGLVLDGRIYRGATGAAGELGQTILGLDLAGAVPAPMGRPQPGSLDFVASGHALDRLADVAGRVHPQSELMRLRAAGKPVLGDAVIDAALRGDESAARMVEVWGQRLGIAVANAIHTFDPEEVVIGGDAARAGELLLEPARRIARGYLRPGLGAHTTVRLARHKRPVVLGAALLARHELER